MKPFAQLANQFHLTEERANNYLWQVQSCFGVPPAHKQIIQFLSQSGETELPLPRETALMMIESGIVSGPLKMEPGYIPSRQRKWGTAYKNLAFESVLDHQRLTPENVSHCPHGVPAGKICAICDPEGFRDTVGVD